MKKVKNFLSSLKRNRVFTRALSMLLSLVLIFYVIPTVVYAEIADAIEAANKDSDEIKLEAPNITVYEDVSLREASVKHFRLSDGTYVAAQYAYPVHYVSEEGTLEDIDNNLAEASGGVYATPTARIKFVKKTNGSAVLFTLKDGSTKLEMSLVGAEKGVRAKVTNFEDSESDTELQKMMNLEKLSSSILYKDIMDGVDLEYVVHSLNVKENIIVKERSDGYSYEFELKLNGLTANLTDGGDVEIKEGDTVKYVIPAPVVFDSAGAYAPASAAAYTLTGGSNGKYTLTVSASAEWMNAEDRVFPVTVDPSVGQIVANGYMYDTYIDADNPDSSLYSADPLRVSSNDTMYWRVVTLPTIPESAYISNATISFYASYVQAEMALSAHLVTTAWGSPMTYTNYLAGASAYESTYQDIVTVSTTGYAVWDITDAYRRWQNGTANYGVAIKPVQTGTNISSNYINFYPIDHEHSDPIFSVTYRNMDGLEDYWTYSSQSAGIAGSGSVNLATGQLTFAIPTLTTTDSLMPFTPTLVYNSSMAGEDYTSESTNVIYDDVRAPLGMMLNTSETIKLVSLTEESGLIQVHPVYTDSDGTEHFFNYNGNDSSPGYYDEDGLGLDLRYSGDYMLLTDRDKTVRVFSGISYGDEWYLSRIEDRSGNAVVFTIDDSLRTTAISLDPAGEVGAIQMLTLHYNSDGRLVRIYNPTSREAVVLRYSSTYNGALVASGGKYLRQIDYAHGSSSVTSANWAAFEASYSSLTNITRDASAYYEYDSLALLTSVKDGLSNRKIAYSQTNYKTTSIQEYAGTNNEPGQCVSYAYGTGYTDVRSSGADDVINNTDDIITRYVLDTNGRAKSVYSFACDGGEIYGAVYGEYETADAAKNSLKQRTALGGTSVNYLLNGGLDVTTSSKSFTHWTAAGSVTRVSTSFGIVGSGYSAEMRPAAGTVAALSQSVTLNPGTYTVSFPYSTQNSPSATGAVQIIDADGSIIHSSLINLNPTGTNGIYNFFQTTFDLSSNGTYTLKISVTNPSSATRAAKVEINEVMLERGTGASDFSYVSYGAFDQSGSTSLSDVWDVGGNVSSLTTVSGAAPFGKSLKITGGYNTGIVSQRIFEAKAADLSSSIINNYGEELTLSGYAYAVNSVLSGNSPFRLVLEISYYRGASNEDAIRRCEVDFLPGVGGWQFASGTFNTLPTAPSGTESDYFLSGDHNDNLSIIRYIDVICEYGEHPNGYALFDNISLVKDSGTTDTYAYTENGYVASISNYYDATYYYYDAQNNVTRIADTRGPVTDYLYDSKYRPLIITTSEITTANYYSYADLAGSTVDLTKKSKTQYGYNIYGLVMSITTSDLAASGAEISDTPDYKTSYTYEYGNNSRLFGALLQEFDLSGAKTNYYYDQSNGDLLATVNVTSGHGTVYTYDAMHRLVSVLPATATSSGYAVTSGAENVTYTYDTFGRLSTISSDSTEYTLGYDAFGNMETAAVGDNTLISCEYNEYNGKLRTMTYANGAVLGYEYNDLELLSEIWYTVNGSTSRETLYEYEYTASGLLYKVKDNRSDSVTEYKYDSRDRVIDMAVSVGAPYHVHSSHVAYNSQDLVSQIYSDVDYLYTDTSAGATSLLTQAMDYTYTYDETGSISEQLYKSGSNIRVTSSYGYDKYSRPAAYTHTYKNGSSTFSRYVGYTYDSKTVSSSNYTSSRVKTYQSTMNGSAITYTYTYDNDGRITMITDSAGQTVRYVYDDLGQLIREDNMPLNLTITYRYDNAGNMIFRGEEAYTQGDAGDYAIERPYGYDNPSWGDQMTEYDGYLSAYDALGNPVSYYAATNYSFTWEGRQLKTAVAFSNTTYQFIYNDQGLRTYKTGTNYYYEGDRLIAEKTSTYTILYIYDTSGSPIGMQYRENTYAEGVWDTFWYDKNLQGDVIAVYSAAGVKLVSYRYTAFGATYVQYHNGGASTAATKNPFRYRGYYYDSDLQLYYLQSRYYDPEVCRFISPDSFISGANGSLHGLNLYAYCFNDPISLTDSAGCWPELNEAREWVQENIFEPTEQFWNELAEDVTSYIDDNIISSDRGTYSTGISINGTLGGNATLNAQVGVSIDRHGKIAIQTSFGGGITTGTPGVSILSYHTLTNAPNVDRLQGPYFQTGGSTTPSIIPVLVLGGDVMLMPDPKNDTAYGGLNGIIGLGTPGAEMHFGWGYTTNQITFNLFE